MSRCGNQSCRSCKPKTQKKKCDPVYDYIVVGAGNAGCTIANRLSENGKYTVCVLEVGKDDTRVPDTLPLASPAPIPQPGDYQWGKYGRAAPFVSNFTAPQLNRGFGHFDWFQEEDENGPVPNRKTTQARHSGWGGCTTHNFGFAIRNAPHNWAEWVQLGLTEFDASTPTSNLIQFYKKVENRTHLVAPGAPFFDTSLPPGSQGSNSQVWYGNNGMVPLLQFAPLAGGAGNPIVVAMQNIINNKLNLNGFNYPTTLVDLDYPPTANQGGLSFNTFTGKFQFGEITPPPGFFGLPQTTTTIAAFNTPMYPNEPLMQFPPEYARVGFSGPVVFERVSSAQAYIYPAENRTNLTVMSEVLVTKIKTKRRCDGSVKATGVKYLEGWNIYQTGRNNSVQTAGYGGTAGDARANAILAQRKGTKTIRARKEVILCAGVFNTPQILQLSGIGDKSELSQMDISTVSHVPGVGNHLIDNQEIFLILAGETPSAVVTFAAKSDPSLANANFDLSTLTVPSFAQESIDPFTQKGWLGVKSEPAIYTAFNRNDFSNILIDTNQNPADPANLVFDPIMIAPGKCWVLYFEQEDGNKTTGTVKIVSKDPTVPPKIIFNYMQHPDDKKTMLDMMYNTVFPIMLELKNTSFFTNLLDPAPVDFLKPGITYSNWTSIDDVDETRLVDYLYRRVGGHHAGGTCKMGVTDINQSLYDPLAVVDQKGRVKGVSGLRICDNSVLPVSIRWPNLTLYVIAEKIANDILTGN